MILLLQNNLILELENCPGDLPFVLCQQLLGRARPASERVDAAIFGDRQITAHGHIENGGGKSLVVEAHAHQVTHRGRRKIRWRLVKRHDDSALGVAAHGRPGNQIVKERHEKAGSQQQRVAIVSKEIFQFFRSRGFRDIALGPHQQNAEAVARKQNSSGRELKIPVLGRSCELCFARSLGTCEAGKGDLVGRNARRQMNGGAGMVDGK
jgi:hypothetical protein